MPIGLINNEIQGKCDIIHSCKNTLLYSESENCFLLVTDRKRGTWEILHHLCTQIEATARLSVPTEEFQIVDGSRRLERDRPIADANEMLLTPLIRHYHDSISYSIVPRIFRCVCFVRDSLFMSASFISFLALTLLLLFPSF
jgi:hypothetical protein